MIKKGYVAIRSETFEGKCLELLVPNIIELKGTISLLETIGEQDGIEKQEIDKAISKALEVAMTTIDAKTVVIK